MCTHVNAYLIASRQWMSRECVCVWDCVLPLYSTGPKSLASLCSNKAMIWICECARLCIFQGWRDLRKSKSTLGRDSWMSAIFAKRLLTNVYIYIWHVTESTNAVIVYIEWVITLKKKCHVEKKNFSFIYFWKLRFYVLKYLSR